MTQQGALTIVTDIKPGKTKEVCQLIAQMVEEDVERNPAIPFGQIPSIHFARFVVIQSNNGKTDQLAFSTDYDKPLNTHLVQLVKVGKRGLHELYCRCEGYPKDAQVPDEEIIQYLMKHVVPYEAFYIGTRGRSVVQIQQEAALREEIEQYLDSQQANGLLESLTPQQIRRNIQQHINSKPEFKQLLALGNTMPPNNQRRLIFRAVVIVVAGIAVLITLGFVHVLIPIALVAVLAGAAAWFLFTLRKKEQTDTFIPPAPDPEKVKQLAAQEDKIVQNQLTHLVTIRPGKFRFNVLKATLGLSDYLARVFFTQGKLLGIPSIHFARWVMIDDKKQLLFFSNFDGSWENYLGDFIDKAAIGLNGVWANTENYPRSKFLFGAGATDEQNFKNWARYQQLPTNLWYSAYKFSTVENINNNTLIRQGLLGEMNDQQVQDWLRKL
jgi:hypothetical protein